MKIIIAMVVFIVSILYFGYSYKHMNKTIIPSKTISNPSSSRERQLLIPVSATQFITVKGIIDSDFELEYETRFLSRSLEKQCRDINKFVGYDREKMIYERLRHDKKLSTEYEIKIPVGVKPHNSNENCNYTIHNLKIIVSSISKKEIRNGNIQISFFDPDKSWHLYEIRELHNTNNYACFPVKGAKDSFYFMCQDAEQKVSKLIDMGLSRWLRDPLNNSTITLNIYKNESLFTGNK